MSRSGLKCGLSIVVPGRVITQAEADVAFRVALSYMSEKWDISFVAFSMVADLYRTFSSFGVPMDSGYVTEAEMLRKLAEQDMPHRINQFAIKSLYSGVGTSSMNFSTFAHAVVIYNRWFMYTSASGDALMGVEAFFAILHDRLIPGYIRRIVDNIIVNIGVDKYASKFRARFAEPGASNLVNIEQSASRDESQAAIDLKPESFVMNFLQRKTKKADGGDAPKSLKEKLEAKGLAVPKFPEHKQRAVVYAILNTEGNGKMTFPQFWNLFKWGDVFYAFTGDNPMVGSITNKMINSHLESLKLRLNDEDLLNIKNLNESLKDHEMNFKHFLIWMNWDRIFAKWDNTFDMGVNREDLEVGLNQMSLPLLKAAVKNGKKGANTVGDQTYDEKLVVTVTLMTEVEICEDIIYRETRTQNLMNDIETKDLCDARSGKCH